MALSKTSLLDDVFWDIFKQCWRGGGYSVGGHNNLLLGTGKKVQGGRVGRSISENVVVRKHMTHPFQLKQNGVTHP